MKIASTTLILLGLIWGCKAKKERTPADCVGTPIPDRVCTMQYDPVCGCDGKTYGNACSAEAAGIKIFTPGECAK